MVQTKLFSDLYLAKFSDLYLANLLDFQRNHSFRVAIISFPIIFDYFLRNFISDTIVRLNKHVYFYPVLPLIVRPLKFLTDRHK